MNLNDLLAKLSKLPPIARLGLLLGLVGVVFLVNYLLVWSDIDGARTAKQSKLATDKKSLKDEQHEQQRELEYRNQIQALQDQARTQQQILPSKSELPSLIEAINGQAQLAGLQITQLKPGEESPEQVWIKIPVGMEVQGTYQQISRFFNDLRLLPRIVNVEGLTLDQATEAEGRVVLHGAFTVLTYRFPERKAASSGAGKGGAK